MQSNRFRQPACMDITKDIGQARSSWRPSEHSHHSPREGSVKTLSTLHMRRWLGRGWLLGCGRQGKADAVSRVMDTQGIMPDKTNSSTLRSNHFTFGWKSDDIEHSWKKFCFNLKHDLAMRCWKSAVLCQDTSGRGEQSPGLSDNSGVWTQHTWKPRPGEWRVVAGQGRADQLMRVPGPGLARPRHQYQPRPQSVRGWALSTSEHHQWSGDTGASPVQTPAWRDQPWPQRPQHRGLVISLDWSLPARPSPPVEPKLSSSAESVKTCEPTNHVVKVNTIYQSGQQMFVNISAGMCCIPCEQCKEHLPDSINALCFIPDWGTS